MMENHIPTVHPEKVRKRISKKEILEPSVDNLVMSATFSERRNLKVDMVRLQNMPCGSQDCRDLHLLHRLEEKLADMPHILHKYQQVEGVDDALLGRELEEQRLVEMREEIAWLSGLQNEQEDSGDEESSVTFPGKVGDEEYRCQYCTFSDQSLYVIRKHLIWNHPDLLLKCVDLRAKPPLSPRVVHMCHRCTFHSVSPVSLLSHYSRNPKHSPGNESDNNNSSSDDELPVLERARRESSSADVSNDDSLPALERSQDKRLPGVKFLSRPLGKPSRNVAFKRVTKSCKNSLRFMQGTQLQCRYCKDFKIHDSTIMKDHLLTEHSGQPAIAIDVRSRELRRTSRVFFCPILECRFTEYGPDALVKHLNMAHPETAFDALIIQICPKDKSADRNNSTQNSSKNSLNTSKNSGTPSSANKNSNTPSLSNKNSNTPLSAKNSNTPTSAKNSNTPTQTKNSSMPISTKNSNTPTSNKNSSTPSSNKTTSSSNKNSSSNSDTKLPELESPKPPKPKSASKKDNHSKNSKKDKSKKAAVVEDEDGLLRGGTMPKISADLTLEKRYWCAYCDAHSACIDKVKAHFLQNHMEQKAQLIDARARVLRKKSRLFFCWNVTCSFTTFLENQFTLHEQSQACLSNFAPDEYETTSKVESHSSGFSTPAGTPEYKPSNSSGSSRMFQCLYCSLMTSSRVNMLSHMAAEHACTSGGYSEISTEFNNDGDIIMNVGGDAETDIAMVDD